MIKSLYIRRSLMMLITSLLVVSQLNLTVFQAFAEEKGEEPLSYEVQEELSKDKKKAKLKIKATSNNNQVEILSIETPDGNKIEGKEAEYTAEKNGDVNFIISYKENIEGKETEIKTFKASYEVKNLIIEKEEANQSKDSVKQNETKAPLKNNQLKSGNDATVTLNIPAYDGTAWANGDIKDVNVTVDFSNSTSTSKEVEFTLPDGMRFVSIPVPSSFQVSTGVDSGVINRLSAGDPIGTAITSVTIPNKETTYDKATFGTVNYKLTPGTEKVSFNFSVRVDANKYYGATDLKAPIKVEAFVGDNKMAIASEEKAIRAEGNKVVGYANQTHVSTMFRNWYKSFRTPDVLASTDDEDSYAYTKSYSVVNGMNQVDERGTNIFSPKNVSTTLYYPEGMEYVGVVNEKYALLNENANTTITHYPEENKVVFDFKQQNFKGVTDTVYAIKYKIPKGTPAGTYTAPKVPHAVITTYDDKVFESDALTNNSTDLTTKATLDACRVVDSTENKMALIVGNKNINPDNETWAGNVRINNKDTAGTKTNQVFQIEFDSNWEASIVNIPFDGNRKDNDITNIQYKTNFDDTYQTYNGNLPKNSMKNIAILEADAVGLQPGEYFTEVKANVGDFSTGYTSYSESGGFGEESTNSYGIVKPGISSVQFKVSIWDEADEVNTKVSGTSVYSVADNITTAANGTANFYNEQGQVIKTAGAGDKFTTKATLVLFNYPYGTRTVLNDPEVYLRQLDGTKILPSSIKLTDQDGEEIEFSIKIETAKNGEKVYVLKTKDATVGRYVGYPSKHKFLNISYDTTIDVTLDKSLHTDIQQLLAWGGPNVKAATAANTFMDTGLDVNQNGIENERLLSANSSTLSVPKQDAVTVETFLNLAGEGAKASYVEGDDSTVSYFTPGTEADYTVRVTNTSTGIASAFELYIPIPKTGQNFGSKFQTETFKWDMKLNDAVQLTDEQKAQFDISYATEANKNNYESESVYSAVPSDYGKVNMVRIKVKTKIDPGETQTIKVPLKVDETFNSATEGNKISERDVYNPYYRVTTNAYSGTLPGTKVGAELIILEASGFLFQDKDANGLYEKAQGDTALANETVELYKWNENTSNYEPFLKNGEPVSVKTNADGKYTFNYNLNLSYGKYAVKFPERAGNQFTLKQVGQDNTINSTVSNKGTDKGWVKEIDPAQPVSQNINAGYMEYAPDNDLKVNLSAKIVQAGKSLKVTLPKVRATSGEAVEDTIEPSFFHNIQAITDGYKWTSNDTTLATTQTANDGSGIIVGISAGNKAIATTDIGITIKDIFDTEKKSTAPVYITEPSATIDQKEGLILGAMNFSLEYKDSNKLTETEAITLAKTASFEEVKTGVLSTAQDCTSSVKVDAKQLKAIQEGSNQGGTYPLTYQVAKNGKTAEVVIQVKVEKDLTTVNVHDSILYLGDTWTATDNFDSALNKVGETVPFGDIQVEGSVDTNTAGIYSVTYTYKGVSKKAKIEVKENLTEINAHDSTIYTGDTWRAGDNFDSGLDKDGNALSLKDLTVIGTVNTNLAGVYTITYKYEDTVSSITVTVKENKKGINGHDSSIYVGEAWTAADNFDNAVDKDGKPVSFADIKVKEEPKVDVNKAGRYQITYNYDGASTTVTLTVKEIKTAINAHDSILYIDDNWSAKDNFDSARDKDGNIVSFNDVQVLGTVDTSQAGTYPITYVYAGITKTIQVIVKHPKTAVRAHDSVIYVGDNWKAQDNWDNTLDKAGQKVKWKDITVKENPAVDVTKPGVYEVTYSYDGISATINVTVKPRKTTVKIHDSSFYAGNSWNAKDNFDYATNKAGEKVAFKDITVAGKVDSKTPGTYEISYVYDVVKAVAKVTVLKNHSILMVKDRVIKVGEKWNAKDSFIQATRRDGKNIPFSQVKVQGKVNLNKAGKYQVIYSVDPNEGTEDAGKQMLSVTATIQVENRGDAGLQDNEPRSVKDNNQRAANSNDIKLIPKTGDQTNQWVLWAGLCLTGLAMLLWGFALRRRKVK
ncbi:DUF5011 domain-containing protein [Listeria monocytogenes]|nr:DUF5011 domain-containing protein [Listeria monocytogenes]